MSFIRRHLKKLVFVVVLALVAGALVRRRMQAVPVVATPVARGTAVEAVYATGTVEAQERITVKAKASGSIAEILVKEGSSVKKGDLLARIDNPVASFELKRGQVDLGAATSQKNQAPQVAALMASQKALVSDLDVATKAQARVRELHAAGAVPKSDLDVAESRVRQVEAQISANQSQQQALRIDLKANAERQAAVVESLASRVADTEVRAPQDGVVLTKLVELGEIVTVNQSLFRVGDTANLILEVMIDEADVAKIRDGSEGAPPSVAAVTLYAFDQQIFTGKVFEIYPDANRERKAFLTKVRLDAPPPGLKSGMSAEVNIISRKKPGVLLAPGVAESDGFVSVVTGGKIERRAVKVGMRDLLRFEVLEGLEEGELVVVEKPADLAAGKRVVVSERPMAPTDPMPDPSQPSQTTIKP
ncbi:MAG: efflux RND transporter periplasmic adaptor subunit [Polyangiaceae bacterium]|nr:efflux RND transporter periplasmic adaptor subunit [Polyangiaceae bacterium]MBK8937030.1 efflux RND transporter periplasmic adaptor subunit [Polyangiaceae bacterium]